MTLIFSPQSHSSGSAGWERRSRLRHSPPTCSRDQSRLGRFVDSPDHPRPLATQPSPLCGRDGLLLRRLRDRRSFRFAGLIVPAAPSPNRARVVAVVADDMKPGGRNVHQEAGQEIMAIEQLGSWPVRPLVPVAGHRPLELEPLERQRDTQQVAGRSAERLEDSARRSRPRLSSADTVTRFLTRSARRRSLGVRAMRVPRGLWAEKPVWPLFQESRSSMRSRSRRPSSDSSVTTFCRKSSSAALSST
jgi:hypothetical protein